MDFQTSGHLLWQNNHPLYVYRYFPLPDFFFLPPFPLQAYCLVIIHLKYDCFYRYMTSSSSTTLVDSDMLFLTIMQNKEFSTPESTFTKVFQARKFLLPRITSPLQTHGCRGGFTSTREADRPKSHKSDETDRFRCDGSPREEK